MVQRRRGIMVQRRRGIMRQRRRRIVRQRRKGVTRQKAFLSSILFVLMLVTLIPRTKDKDPDESDSDLLLEELEISDDEVEDGSSFQASNLPLQGPFDPARFSGLLIIKNSTGHDVCGGCMYKRNFGLTLPDCLLDPSVGSKPRVRLLHENGAKELEVIGTDILSEEDVAVLEFAHTHNLMINETQLANASYPLEHGSDALWFGRNDVGLQWEQMQIISSNFCRNASSPKKPCALPLGRSMLHGYPGLPLLKLGYAPGCHDPNCDIDQGKPGMDLIVGLFKHEDNSDPAQSQVVFTPVGDAKDLIDKKVNQMQFNPWIFARARFLVPLFMIIACCLQWSRITHFFFWILHDVCKMFEGMFRFCVAMCWIFMYLWWIPTIVLDNLQGIVASWQNGVFGMAYVIRLFCCLVCEILLGRFRPVMV